MMNSLSIIFVFALMMLFTIGHIEMAILRICGPNEVPIDCAPALTCQPSCDNANETTCPRICKRGLCVCKDGYVRDNNKNYQCIEPSQCISHKNIIVRPSKCGPNEVESQCVASQLCQPSCDNPNGTVCPTICSRNSCQCKDGYIRQSKNDLTCVLKAQCEQENN